jgi:hypothetical protein
MRQIKAPIAGNSKAITKIGNAELAHFNKQMLIHELIRGSLGSTQYVRFTRLSGRQEIDRIGDLQANLHIAPVYGATRHTWRT